MRADFRRWSLVRQEALPLDEVLAAADLAQALRPWRSHDALPTRVDPLRVPPHLLPHVLLLDLDVRRRSLRVRLAGTAICQRFGGELRGIEPDIVLTPEAAASCLSAALQLAVSRAPQAAHCCCEAADNGEIWRHLRVAAPISRGGDGQVDGVFEILVPQALETPSARPEPAPSHPPLPLG